MSKIIISSKHCSIAVRLLVSCDNKEIYTEHEMHLFPAMVLW